jgi:transposase
MAMLSFAGIDVSKDRLDVVVLPEEECSSVPNAAGWAELIEQLHGFSVSAIGIEASGGYERGVMRALLAAGMPVRQVNPFKLRQFARASGGAGEERSTRCPHDRVVRRHHADAPSAAAGAGSRTAGRVARRPPPTERRESRRRECLQTKP